MANANVPRKKKTFSKKNIQINLKRINMNYDIIYIYTLYLYFFCYRYKSSCCVIGQSADLYIFHPDV